MKGITTAILFLLALTASAQFGNQGSAGFQWNASWITVPGAGESSPGLYLFRKTLTLDAVPDSFVVYVSADNRYKLYVNEKLVSMGPAPGDIQHWIYSMIHVLVLTNKLSL